MEEGNGLPEQTIGGEDFNAVAATVAENDTTPVSPTAGIKESIHKEKDGAMEASEASDPSVSDVDSAEDSTVVDDSSVVSISEGSLENTLLLSQGLYGCSCCAICLEGYEAGETVIWSPLEHCKHAYHGSCMVDYIVAKDLSEGSDVECPTCRECFVVLPSNVEEESLDV